MTTVMNALKRSRISGLTGLAMNALKQLQMIVMPKKEYLMHRAIALALRGRSFILKMA
jgi:hypothetical protein